MVQAPVGEPRRPAFPSQSTDRPDYGRI